MNIEQGFIRLLRIIDLFPAEKQEIGENQERGQIEQVGHLQKYSRFLASLMKAKGFQNNYGNYEKYAITDQKKCLKDSVKEIAHIVGL